MKLSTAIRLGIAASVAALAHAQAPNRSPLSKIYVADAEGESQVDVGSKISVLAKKAVYKGEGAAIETKPTSNASIVLSNGIGIYFDVATRVRVRAFQQAPFRSTGADMEDEPSISRTDMAIDYGVVGVSTGKMAAGSTLLFGSSLATAEVHGRQAVFQIGDAVTKISMLLGGATIRAGASDPGRELKEGQQIIIRPGNAGSSPRIALI